MSQDTDGIRYGFGVVLGFAALVVLVIGVVAVVRALLP